MEQGAGSVVGEGIVLQWLSWVLRGNLISCARRSSCGPRFNGTRSRHSPNVPAMVIVFGTPMNPLRTCGCILFRTVAILFYGRRVHDGCSVRIRHTSHHIANKNIGLCIHRRHYIFCGRCWRRKRACFYVADIHWPIQTSVKCHTQKTCGAEQRR